MIKAIFVAGIGEFETGEGGPTRVLERIVQTPDGVQRHGLLICRSQRVSVASLETGLFETAGSVQMIEALTLYFGAVSQFRLCRQVLLQLREDKDTTGTSVVGEKRPTDSSLYQSRRLRVCR